MAGESRLEVGRFSDGFLVRIVGCGTMCESHAFREFVTQCFARENGSVVVDMSQCDYLDSTFLGCLIGLQKKSEHDPSRFVIAAGQADRVRLFATSTLDRYLLFTDECPTAISHVILETPMLPMTKLGEHVMQSHRQLASLECKESDTFKAVADRLAEELET